MGVKPGSEPGGLAFCDAHDLPSLPCPYVQLSSYVRCQGFLEKSQGKCLLLLKDPFHYTLFKGLSPEGYAILSPKISEGQTNLLP